MKRIDEVLIQGKPGAAVAALRRAGELIDLAFDENDSEPAAGDIYLARVGKLVPAIQAAFIDLGSTDDGFLGLQDARPAESLSDAVGGDRLGDYVREGEAVLVQVLRGASPGKGPKLTRRLTLPGGFAVLAAGVDRISLSRRIQDKAERKRLIDLVERHRLAGEGWVLRTQAAGVDETHLVAEMTDLRDRYKTLAGATAGAKPPVKVFGDGALLPRLLRDVLADSPRRVVVEDAALLAELRNLLAVRDPGLAERLERHRGEASLFAAEGVADQIDAALGDRVPLSGGGAITLEATAACVAIDVDQGGARGNDAAATALTVNLAAADALARQIRLRNVSGLIVVDFISMKDAGHRAKVLTALRRAVEDDPLAVQVAGFTTFGLVEMTRPRRRPSLAERSHLDLGIGRHDGS